MCPLRFLLVFVSGMVALYLAWVTWAEFRPPSAVAEGGEEDADAGSADVAVLEDSCEGKNGAEGTCCVRPGFNGEEEGCGDGLTPSSSGRDVASDGNSAGSFGRVRRSLDPLRPLVECRDGLRGLMGRFCQWDAPSPRRTAGLDPGAAMCVGEGHSSPSLDNREVGGAPSPTAAVCPRSLPPPSPSRSCTRPPSPFSTCSLVDTFIKRWYQEEVAPPHGGRAAQGESPPPPSPDPQRRWQAG